MISHIHHKPIYVELDSSFRDRLQYPNSARFTNTPSDSVVLKTFPVANVTGDTASHTGTLVSPSATSTVLTSTSPTPLSPIDNYYNGCSIAVTTALGVVITRVVSYSGSTGYALLSPSIPAVTSNSYTLGDPSTAAQIFVPPPHPDMAGMYLVDTTTHETRRISSVQFTNIAVLDSPFSAAWSISDKYEIVPQLPTQNLALGASNVVAPDKISVAGSTHLYQPGDYVRITPPDKIARIVGLDPVSATLQIQPAIAAVGSQFQLLGQSTSAPSIRRPPQPQRYEVTLKTLVLPNTAVKSSQGGRLSSYPHLYVEFGNLQSAFGMPVRVIVSNNPSVTRACFKTHLLDLQPPPITKFVKASSAMKIVMYIDPYSDLQLHISLPSGEPLQFVQADNMNPLDVNPELQVSAEFELKPLPLTYTKHCGALQ